MITINRLRISPDRKYLEYDIETIEGYIFKDFIVRTQNPDNPQINIGDSVFKKINNREIGNIDANTVPLYGGDNMYFVTFTIEWTGIAGDEPESNTACNCVTCITAVAVDFSQFYFCMVKYAMDLDQSCQDNKYKLLNMYYMRDLLRSAILLERWDDAIYWFNLLKDECSPSCTTTQSCNIDIVPDFNRGTTYITKCNTC